MEKPIITQFGLRNYAKVLARWNGKMEKYNDFLKSNFQCLEPEEIYNAVHNSAMFQFGWIKSEIDLFKQVGKKERFVVKILKTFINNLTWEAHRVQISDSLGLKPSTASKYATKAYLMHYTQVNRNMEEALFELLKEIGIKTTTKPKANIVWTPYLAKVKAQHKRSKCRLGNIL